MKRTKDESGRHEFELFVVDATDALYRTAYFMTWDSAEAGKP
jgi:hypothetical protein